MMEPIRVTPTKLALFIGILDEAFFVPILLFSAYLLLQESNFTTLIICSAVFGVFILVGLILIYSYFREKLIFSQNSFTYRPLFGTTKTIYYYEVQTLKVGATSQYGTDFIFISHEGKHLANFSSNMYNYEEALQFLQLRGIKFEQSKARERKFTAREKERKQALEENIYISMNWSPEQMEKERKINRLLRFGLALVLILSFFLPLNLRLWCYIILLLTIYGMILWFYPKMTGDSDSYHLPFPWITCFATFILVIYWGTGFDIDENGIYPIFFTYYIVMLLLYFMTLLIKKRKEKISKILWLIFGITMFAFGILFVFPVASTFDHVTQTPVTVVDKYYVENSKYNSYYVLIECSGEYRNFQVPVILYRTTEPGGTLVLYQGESIFGIRWSALFKKSTPQTPVFAPILGCTSQILYLGYVVTY